MERISVDSSNLVSLVMMRIVAHLRLSLIMIFIDILMFRQMFIAILWDQIQKAHISTEILEIRMTSKKYNTT